MHTETELKTAIGRLDLWLDTMRTPQGGYSGPVSHWWDSCLIYTGAMHDWRYEGIVCGYLNLYRQTNDSNWIEKACHACDNLISAQTPDSHFTNSCFEHGPKTFGTPHEAAVDIALLETAQTLKKNNDLRWKIYLDTAERNIKILLTLFNGEGFQDQPNNPVLVPNKNATMLEALFLYQELANQDMEKFIEAAVEVILKAQVKEGARKGATIHSGTFKYQISFGIYTSRCIGALTRIMKERPNTQYLDFIKSGCDYLQTLIRPNATLLGHYSRGAICAPQWISASGDLLRALLQAREWIDIPEENIQLLASIMIKAQMPSGGIPTSYGLAKRGSRTFSSELPDFRDVLPVVGWCDKSFRALTMIGTANNTAKLAEAEIKCQWRHQNTTYHEDDKRISLINKEGRPIYLWKKGNTYPVIMELWN